MELKDYLAGVLSERERSIRYVARKTGLSHTTIHRILEGFTNVDMDTARALAKWCGIETARIIGMVDPDGYKSFSLESDIAALMETYPWMREAWTEILEAHKGGTLTIEDLKAAMDFAAMKLNQKKPS